MIRTKYRRPLRSHYFVLDRTPVPSRPVAIRRHEPIDGLDGAENRQCGRDRKAANQNDDFVPAHGRKP
jgi:hypothetical protein